MDEPLNVTRDARGVVTITLNVPQKHNAMSAQMIASLTDLAHELAQDDSRVVVLTGAGVSFCAGGDLDWMRNQMGADGATRAHEARKLAELLRVLNALPKPLIGRVQGQAFGGGVGLMCVCDVAIGVEGAKFGLTETRLGLTPATIGPYVVARMGEGRARRVFMSARIFDAVEAVDLGLLSRCVARGDLDAVVASEVNAYLSCAPGAVARAKAQVRRLGPVIDQSVIDASIADLVAMWESEEAIEGVAAFFDRRPPHWKR